MVGRVSFESFNCTRYLPCSNSDIIRLYELEVVVCIVADGRRAINPRILDWLVLPLVFSPLIFLFFPY